MIKSSDTLLKNLQAGILKNDGRCHKAFLYLSFKKTPSKVRELLSTIKVTSAFQQKKDTAICKNAKTLSQTQKLVTSLYLSAKGYQFLRCPSDSYPSAIAFRNGMSSRDLGDPAVDEWEAPFQKGVDALLMIANESKAIIEREINRYEKEWFGYIEILKIQDGIKLENNQGQTIEHFGYVDGVSQPVFDKVKKRIASPGWDPSAPLELVLEKDPGTSEKEAYGSFLVFRKLEQNVKAFKEAEEALAEQLGLSGEAEEIAGALMVGRFENGLPVVKLGSVASPEEVNEDNNFDYSIDPEGQRCPFHAHIRKVNPRGDSKRFFGISDETERSHRIIRRGITYDDIGRNGNLTVHPEGGVGLLFLCFQRDIENQFEFIQRFWANNNDFPVPYTGIDPIIGQGENRKDTNGEEAEQKWTTIDRQQSAKSISSFVTMMGGEYFFAPSIPTIRSFGKTKKQA